MSVLLDILSWALLLFGGFVGIVAGIGILRMPDVFTRMHAAGMLDTLGAGCILLGLALQSGFTLITVKLALVLGFLILTTATAAHALAKSARTAGLEPLTGEDLANGVTEQKSSRAPEVSSSDR